MVVTVSRGDLAKWAKDLRESRNSMTMKAFSTTGRVAAEMEAYLEAQPDRSDDPFNEEPEGET